MVSGQVGGILLQAVPRRNPRSYRLPEGSEGRKCSVTLEQPIENWPVRSDSRDFGVPGSFLPPGIAWTFC